MSTRTLAATSNDWRTDEHPSTKPRGVNPIDALLRFYGTIAFLTFAFIACTGLAIYFSGHNIYPAAPVAGWAGFAFFVVDLFYIGLDWEI